MDGFGLDAEGERIRVRVNEDTQVTLLQSGFANMPMYRDLLAAIRVRVWRPRAAAAADRRERARSDRISRAQLLEGLYLAVTCHDYPQLWDPAAPLGLRMTQLTQARAALPAERFAPFSPQVQHAQAARGHARAMTV